MSIQALQLNPGAAGSDLARISLDVHSAQAFLKNRPVELPSAFLVRNDDLAHLRKLPDVVIDRGTKNKAKPLSKLLLGHQKIPLLAGSYTDAGQLVRSLRTLLENAKKRKERNLYVIGANAPIFEELWQGVGTKAAAEPAQRVRTERSDSFSAQESSRLIREEVPVSLENRFVGRSYDMHLVRQLILRAAHSDEAVLILGDSGTGKEIVARCIHDYGDTPQHPFVPVNCAAIPPDLLEAVLFGHDRHIFTGAEIERIGLWKEAGKGTVFLDEIADLRPDHQAKILRGLQEKKIRPLGKSAEVDVPARIIAATNRDLFSMIRAGQFREDLYYRLRSFLIRTPSLRDHPEDIPALSRFFWKEITKSKTASLPEPVHSELQQYRWPGNARELRAVLANLHILFGKENLDVEHLRLVFRLEGQMAGSRVSGPAAESEMQLHRVECFRHLKQVDEVIHACKAAADPIVLERKQDPRTKESVQTQLHRRYQELESLCRQPLLFHSELTYSVVYRLKGKLLYFLSLLETNVRSALRFWKREVSSEFRLALTAVFKEVQQLLPQKL